MSGTPRFATTHWSLILEARAGEDDALAQLCRDYWYPLYAFARRRGSNAHEAEDRVQSFFAHLLQGQDRLSPDPAQGRFRSWLITAFKNHESHLREKDQAQKRGGGVKLLHFDVREAESWLEAAGLDDTPERGFERAWAESLLTQAKLRLRDELGSNGKRDLFERLEEGLSLPEPRGGHQAAARDLGLSEGALRVALHRLRHSFGDTLRQVVAETLGPEDRIDDELGALISALAVSKKDGESP